MWLLLLACNAGKEGELGWSDEVGTDESRPVQDDTSGEETAADETATETGPETSGETATETSGETASETSGETATDTSADTAADTGDPSTPEPLGDFALVDQNPTSSRYGETVSPRDYLERTSGWYFVHST